MSSKIFSYTLQIPSVILNPKINTKGVVLLFHGHAQMPCELDSLANLLLDEGFVILQLQAPHAFSTPRGKIVSTWMSKFNRDAEIQAQVNYLNQVNEYLSKEFFGLPWMAIGFSQGAVVAYRAWFMSELKLSCCFCIAGDLPPEIKNNIAIYESKKYGKIILICGSEDSVVPFKKIKEDHYFLESHGYPVTLHQFTGLHEVPLELIKQLLKKI